MAASRRASVSGAIRSISVLAAVAMAGACDSRSPPEGVVGVRAELTATFALPVAVGLSPMDVALGATGLVTVNDVASVSAAAGSDNSIVALGSGTTNIGYNARIGKLWSAPSLLLRHSNLSYFKTAGTASIQAGTVFATPAENRTGVPVRQDPIWTVSLSAPDSGTPVNVFSQQTQTLTAGNYGSTTVFNGGTLILSGGGNFGFASLDIEPGAVVRVDSPTTTSIFVNANLILRSPLGGGGMIFSYLGSAAASVDARFTGDLFLAPNADVSIKASSTGRFFARNITLFEATNVAAPALLSRSQQFVRPVEVLQFPGAPKPAQFDPGPIEGEISATVMTPALTPSCAEPVGFISHHGNDIFFRTLSSIGSTTPASLPSPLPFVYPPPANCIGSFPGNQYKWPFNVALGRPFYSDQGAFTDNLTTRLDGGRMLFAGFSERYCEDPSTNVPLAPGCPATLPASGATCDPSVTTGSCVYGATPGTQCSCCGPGGGTGNPDDTVCASSNTSAPGAFVCGPLQREEARVIGLRMSSDCGSTWTTGDLDQAVLLPGHQDRDRPEVYFDPFDKKVYLAERTNLPQPTANSIFVANTNGVTNAGNFSFSVARNTTADLGFPLVMTTVLDEQALLANGTHGRWVHLVSARCSGNQVLLDVETPFGRRSFNLVDGSDGATVCNDLGQGGSRMPFFGLHYGPSIAGTSSSPPRVTVAYTGLNSAGFLIINLVSVALLSTNQYAGPPTITRAKIDESSTNRDLLWPQLIRPDNLAGSDLLIDTPVILRYASWNSDIVQEKAIAIYSGLQGPKITIAAWSVSTAFGQSAAQCATAGSFCFAGDYRYGSFIDKTNGSLNFFTPWSGHSTLSPGTPGIYAQGATIQIVP
jgi:hypothetical protein